MDGGASVAARCRISRFTIGNCVASPGMIKSRTLLRFALRATQSCIAGPSQTFRLLCKVGRMTTRKSDGSVAQYRVVDQAHQRIDALAAEPSVASEISILRESRRYYDCRPKRGLIAIGEGQNPALTNGAAANGSPFRLSQHRTPSLVVSLLKEAHSRICQTSAASPAQPAHLPTD